MTQSIEIKNFTGGMNSVTDPYNLYPTEAQVMRNITVDDVGMQSKFYVLQERLSAPGRFPLNIVVKRSEIHPIDNNSKSLYEKVRNFQGEKYHLIEGIPNKLTTPPTPVIVENTLDATVTQMLGLNDEYEKVKYNYFISYRNENGFESPLKEIKTIYGQNSVVNTVHTEDFQDIAGAQDLIINTYPPDEKGYGRIYRMGDNISHPSLVFQFDYDKNISLSDKEVTVDGNKFSFSINDEELSDLSTTWGTVTPDGLQYLTHTKFGLAASKGSQVYLSLGKPDAWSELSMLNFGSKVTGLASVYRGFVVFTEELNLYIITGSSLSNLSVDILSTDVGCHSNGSIAEVGHHTLLWVYNKSLYSFSGRQVKEFEPHTYEIEFFEKYGYDRDLTGVSLDSKYLLGIDNGLIEVDLSHRYKPFIEFELPGAFNIKGFPGIIREAQIDGLRQLVVYGPDGSFWWLKETTYTDIVDTNVEETDNWGRGGYAGYPAEVDGTTCLLLGKYGEYQGEEWLPESLEPDDCVDEGKVGIYPNYTKDGYTPDISTFRSKYISPSFTFGDVPQLVTYSSVEVFVKGTIEVVIRIDDKEVYRKEHITTRRGTVRCILNNRVVRGVTCEVEFNFVGHIYSFRVNAEPHQQTSK